MKPITDPAVLARVVTILNAGTAGASNADRSKNHEPCLARCLNGSDDGGESRRAA